eukprot:9312312-Pyramimonas_sp.AAC.1
MVIELPMIAVHGLHGLFRQRAQASDPHLLTAHVESWRRLILAFLPKESGASDVTKLRGII